jgi:UPF0755 protein
VNPTEEFDPSGVPPVRRTRRSADNGGPGAGPRASGTRPAGPDASVTRTASTAGSPSGPVGRSDGPSARPHGTDADEYVVLPRPTRGGRRLLTVAAAVLVVAGIVVGTALIWASRQVNPPGDPGDAIEELVVPRGSSTEAIGTLLQDAGVITSARMFRYYVDWKGAGPWEAGTYIDFRRDSSFDEAIDVLDGGPLPATSSVVRVVEGRRLVDALADIASQMDGVTVEQLEQALTSGAVVSRYRPPDAPWEGFLFPDTYQVAEDVTPAGILQAMATKMDNVLDELDYDKAEILRGRTAYELLTIASLVEKETGAPPEERGMIARTILNRLEVGEALGIDATVLYGLGRSSGTLTRSDLDTETPYNTRLVTGLPPTPIALPGRASLNAAISPAEGDWRYYVLVSNDPPSHFFTDSYREFVNAKNDAQRRGVF